MLIESEWRPKELIGYIYKFTNITNGKCYIGKTANLERRLWEHQNETCKKDTAFGRALRKYGYDNFKLELLIKIKRINTKKQLNTILDNLERYYINKYNSFHFGYNLTKGGDGSLEFHHSEETKKKMSVTRKNMSEEYKEKLREQLLKVSEKYRFKKGQIIPRRHTEVEQYTLNNEYIKTFYSIKAAALSLGNRRADSSIVRVCKGKSKKAYGYIWKYKLN